MKVLAAMSGGVDSAVAAARAVEAGHDVTGVHLALSRNPQSFRSGARGCCTIEDSTTRAAPPTSSGSPSTSGISASASARTWSRTSSPSTPPAAPPTRACAATRRSSSPRCSTGRSALGFDAVGHGALRAAARPGPTGDRDAPRDRHGQGPVVRPRRADPGQLAHAMFPLGDTTPRTRSAPRPSAAGSPSPRSPTATTSASSPTATPRAGSRELGEADPGATSSTSPARSSAPTTGRSASRSASARACASAPGLRRQAALRARHLAGGQHGDGRPATASPSTAHRHQAPLVRRGPDRRARITVQLRAHGEEFAAVARVVNEPFGPEEDEPSDRKSRRTVRPSRSL